MTPRERANVAAWAINAKCCNVAEMTYNQPKARGIIESAIRAAVEEEREACCRDVCARCRDSHRLMDSDDVGHLGLNYRYSHSGYERCEAYAIRARGGQG